MLALARKDLSACSFRLFIGEKPNINSLFEDLSTDFTEEELEEALVDEWGVKYSKDGRKLLKVPEELDGTYSVKKGTKIICDSAFCCCGFLSSVVIPDSVTSIGYNAFYDCRSLSNIIFPNSVTNIGGGAFWLCCLLTSIVIPNSVVSIEEYTFMDCCSLLNIVIPDSVTSIGGVCIFRLQFFDKHHNSK